MRGGSAAVANDEDRYVLNGNNTLRIIVTSAIAALAVAVPVAEAKQTTTATPVTVCNQATHNSVGGDLIATDGDSGAASKFQDNLQGKNGHGAGLVNAAANSPALTLCSKPADTPPPTDTGGGDSGGMN